MPTKTTATASTPQPRKPPCATCPNFAEHPSLPGLALCTAYAPDWRGHAQIPASYPGCAQHPHWPEFANAWAKANPYDPTPTP